MSSDQQILLGLTTTGISRWRDKAEEIRQLNLREVALLPTALKPAERQALYKLLESAGLEAAPYVHLRDDFTVEEVDYLVGRFKVKALSCHADEKGYALLDKLPKYNSIIYVENFAAENADKLFNPQYFSKHQVSGICLDLAHLEETRRSSKRHYKNVLAMMDKYPVRVTQISGVKTSVLFKMFHKTYVDHSLDSLNDLAYVKQYPPHYFAKLIVLELENSFLEQLEIKKFVESLVP
jgi:hypothetical protein